MKYYLLILSVLVAAAINAQELFVFTEPASNMAAKSIGMRLNNYFMKESYISRYDYHLIPEVMVGVSKKMMVHADAFFSNRNGGMVAEGGSLYAKYRVYSNDDVQRHFRVAAFSRFSFNNSVLNQEEINLYGYNSGFEGGFVATQLLHKVALASAISFVNAVNNGSHIFWNGSPRAINYTLSFGKLLLPKEYRDYRQTNLNMMLELLSQYNTGARAYYLDIAPSVQLIINSVARLDAGYRRQLKSTLFRTSADGLFIRVEYNLFNAY